MGITSEIAGAAAGMFVVMMVVYLLGFGISIAAYVLQSLGYYTIAQRRGIKHPWMAWVPLLNLWILGSISDQYRYVARGQIRNRRKVLLGVAIGMAVCCVALFAAYIVMMFNMLSNIDMINTMVPEQMLSAMTGSFVTLGIVGFVSWVLAILLTVFQYVCLFDLYASCSPDNKVIFLVLSILINVTLPVFVFVCRKKDGGMPPRKEEVQPVYIAEPVVTVEE